MKLTSKEICPITVRDRLIKNLAGQDVNICDLVKAVEWAEAKCLELNKENEETNIKANDIICRLSDEKYVGEKIINELNKEKGDCLERIIKAIKCLKNPSHNELNDTEQIENNVYDVVIAAIQTQINE